MKTQVSESNLTRQAVEILTEISSYDGQIQHQSLFCPGTKYYNACKSHDTQLLLTTTWFKIYKIQQMQHLTSWNNPNSKINKQWPNSTEQSPSSEADSILSYSRNSTDETDRSCVVYTLTEAMATGESDKFSTVARSSSTLALIGAEPLLNGLISTWILCSRSSSAIKESTMTNYFKNYESW